MSKPIALVTHTDASHEEKVASVIHQLEQWLVKAKAGELEGIAVAALYSDGACGCGFSASASYFRLLGAITDLQHMYVMKHER